MENKHFALFYNLFATSGNKNTNVLQTHTALPKHVNIQQIQDKQTKTRKALRTHQNTTDVIPEDTTKGCTQRGHVKLGLGGCVFTLVRLFVGWSICQQD